MHTAIKTRKPDIAKNMEVVPPVGTWLDNCLAAVPLYDSLCQSSNFYIEADMYGYTLSAACKDIADVERYIDN